MKMHINYLNHTSSISFTLRTQPPMCVQPICWEKTANRVHANEERRGVKSMRLNERKAVTCYTPVIAERLQSSVTESCETCTGTRHWTHVCVWHTCTHLCSKDIILIGNHANKGKYMHSAHGRIVTINLCVSVCVSLRVLYRVPLPSIILWGWKIKSVRKRQKQLFDWPLEVGSKLRFYH